jgi:hypothetical protein
LGAFVLAPLVIWLAVPLPSTIASFLLGAYTVAILAFVGWAMSLATATSNLVRGIVAERATAEVLAPRKARRHGWRLVPGLHFARHGDVDQVLICPAGVWAVEVKWTSEAAEVVNGCLVGPWPRSPLDQARRGAELVDRATRSTKAKADVSPRPLVVIWGPGAPDLPGGWTTVEDVLVMSSPTRDEVLAALDNHAVPDAAVLDRACTELVRLSEKQRRYGKGVE